MDLNVIKVGNSKGLRLPKAILDEYHIGDQVHLTLKEDCIELRPKSNPRHGWKEKFKLMSNKNHDDLIIPDVFEDEEL